ncbi:MAG: hypothetical protein NHF88_01005 [Candidatus Shikimatogenerans bostrichidophilus]|nr:MAG: hypothetical protein NHF88_01005 [Candidatus Shikimatogenerans bostrichidophilus]
MLKIIKQLEYIYSLQLLENKKKKINKIYKYIPKLYKKYIKNIKNKKNKIIIINKKLLYNKNKILYLNKQENIHNSLINKYQIDKNIIDNLKDLNNLNKEIEYSKLKINYINKQRKKINKNIVKINKINESILNHIDIIKYKIKIKKKKLKILLLYIKKNLPKIYKLINYYINKVKSYKIYKKFLFIKNKSIDNIGIVSIYKNKAIEGIYLTIPKYIYYKLNKNKKIFYDYYTGKILISKNLSDKIKNKLNKKLMIYL